MSRPATKHTPHKADKRCAHAPCTPEQFRACRAAVRLCHRQTANHPSKSSLPWAGSKLSQQIIFAMGRPQIIWGRPCSVDSCCAQESLHFAHQWHVALNSRHDTSIPAAWCTAESRGGLPARRSGRARPQTTPLPDSTSGAAELARARQQQGCWVQACTHTEYTARCEVVMTAPSYRYMQHAD